jgi:tRNA-binding EMAP/Myf-like protein
MERSQLQSVNIKITLSEKVHKQRRYYYCAPVLVIDKGAVVGRALKIEDHPNGQRIWLAHVDLGDGGPAVQIVFGGRYRVQPGQLVPVAPPGARVSVLKDMTVSRTKKMRSRSYRGERSHGMLCSLDELGWSVDGPDEVAILRGLEPGDSLDDVHLELREQLVARPHCLSNLDTDTLVMPAVVTG